MSATQDGSTMIEGRVVRKTSSALQLTFHSGPGHPLAVAVRGTDRHRITYADGSVVWVRSSDVAATVLSRGDGSAIGTIALADTSTAVGSTAGTLFHFVPDPEEPATPEMFHLRLLDRMGAEIGRLDVVRTVRGWALGRIAKELNDTYIWWDRDGQPLPVPILGTRLLMSRQLDRVECDVLLGACVDIALGLRPYVAAMR
ncbi:hypothetical protein ACIP5Y_01655 [Nocardia sp. NPDC088792]|uniref:hypothetical protein n=1 Tax=Nocardia sp. NPDC088792 TaxID=3364332 RepID=UPI0038185EDA